MNLNDLPAQELARIDAICLQYEEDLRGGRKVPLDEIVDRLGGEHAELLRRELDAIREEVEQAINPTPLAPIESPFQVPDPEVKASLMDEPVANENESDHSATSSGSSALSSASLPSQDDLTKQSGHSSPRVSPASVKLPSTGDRIGPYLLRNTIGRGGMGVVFQAVDTRLDREVAIKFLTVDGAKQQELNDRFEREAKAVAALSHPNIVELFDVGLTEGLPYAVMEFLRGETLDERLKRGKLSAFEVRYIGAQIADALSVAHEHGVVHRDLKPQNVMITGKRATGDPDSSGSVSRFEVAANRPLSASDTTTGLVKVLDFGLSRVSNEQLAGDGLQTREGVIMGTPGYMSPEQARSEPATQSADIFSLGCILYELFYGAEAVKGETVADRLAATLMQPIPEPDPIRRREDMALADLIERCLEKEAINRPNSAAEVANSLRSSSSEVDPVMAKIDAGYTSGEFLRRRFLAAIGGGFVGSIVGASIVGNQVNKLQDIELIAVLSLDDGTDTDPTAEKIQDRDLTRAEKLAGAIVNELSRLDSSLAVLPFRPMIAKTPNDIVRLGEELDVSAFVTGSARTIKKGSKEILDVDLQIVSAKTGEQLWFYEKEFEDGDNMLQRTLLASQIADAIGKRLTSSAEKEDLRDPRSYTCLVDGRVRSDLDTKLGMTKALMCLEHAHKFDQFYAEPLAGIALTAMALAAQSSREDAEKYYTRARDAAKDALELDPKSANALLATAMIDWQILQNYDGAESKFAKLLRDHQYNWQIHHQYGLLALATNQPTIASNSLRSASRLNPMSMAIKIDRVRADWFDGRAEQALGDAEHLASQWKDNAFAIGLAIDICEQQEMYAEAAKFDREFGITGSLDAATYFEQRETRLTELPYGAFGEVMNRAIWQMRSHPPEAINNAWLGDLESSLSPMFPLLLSRHPAFSKAMRLERAKELLPK